MHIPDGYLGPSTCAAAFAVMIPVWAAASRKVRSSLKQRQVPMLAVSAAFSFVIMMFNIPVPGGTTGHATGAVLAAVLLGPWAGCLAVSVALVIQSLLFGDGGLTAIGANCFTMAFVMVFSGYSVYRLVSRGSPPGSRIRVIAAAAAGYVGLNLAALSTAFLFGIQPALHRLPSGQPLYCPFGVKAAVTAMGLQHLLVFGWVEALVTAMVVRYLQKRDTGLLTAAEGK